MTNEIAMNTKSPSQVGRPDDPNRYNEMLADLSTIEKRIDWFCGRFNVEPPKLSRDPDEPSQLLLTENLLDWCYAEGVSFDWLFVGTIGGLLHAFRQERLRQDQPV